MQQARTLIDLELNTKGKLDSSRINDLSSLTTTDKGSLVLAINEVNLKYGNTPSWITNQPTNPSVLVDFTTGSKGIIFPIVQESVRTAMTTSNGLTVYQSDATQGVYTYKSGAWWRNLYVDSNGKIDIPTLYLDNTLGKKVVLYDGGTTNGYYGFSVNSSDFTYNIPSTNDSHNFKVNGTQVAKISGSGSLLVGSSTASTNSGLEVNNGKWLSVRSNVASTTVGVPQGISLGWNASNGQYESNIVWSTQTYSSSNLAIQSWDGTNLVDRLLVYTDGVQTRGRFQVNPSQDGTIVFGYQYKSAGGVPTTYYKIATLPASDAGTYDHVRVQGVLNANWSGNANTVFDVTLGNRSPFGYRFTLSGFPTGNAGVAAYTETNGTVSIYLYTYNGTYSSISANLTNVYQATVYRNPTSVSTPTGTLVFNTSSSTPNLYSPISDGLAIGTNSIDNSAVFQLNSTTKGALLPRMTQSQRSSISSPATGLIVFQTDGTAGLYLFIGGTWRQISVV